MQSQDAYNFAEFSAAPSQAAGAAPRPVVAEFLALIHLIIILPLILLGLISGLLLLH